MITEFLQRFFSESFSRVLATFFVGTLVVGGSTLVLVRACYFVLGKRRVEVVKKTLQLHSGLAFLTGLAALVVHCSLLYALTLFGFTTPLASGLASSAVWLTLIVGYAGMSQYVVDGFMSWGNSLGWLLVGAMLITILQVIPLVGPLFVLAFASWSLGAAVLTGLGSDRDWLIKRLRR